MYAIVDIAGQQFKVEKGQELFVHRLEGEKGAKLDFDKVMLIDHEGKTIVGTPVIDGAHVEREVVEENADHIVYVNHEGILMKEMKNNPASSMPQFLRFPVQTRADVRRFDGALSDYDKAIELNPRFSEAYHNRGRIYGDADRVT